MRSDACEKALHTVYLRYVQLTCKTGKFTCIYAASTSRRIHASARNKARKLRVNSPAVCKLTYLQFASEFTRGVIAVLAAIAGIFANNCGWFGQQISCIFARKSRQFCMLVAGKFTRVPHVKLPVKYSDIFTCSCRQFAGILREVFAA